MSTSPRKSYDILTQSLQKAQSFEEICAFLHDAIGSDCSESHKDLYAFLSQNPDAIAAIDRFKDHEEFHTALWSIIYDEHADLTKLPKLAGAVQFSVAITPLDKNKSLVVIDSALYPAVIDNTHCPVVLDTTDDSIAILSLPTNLKSRRQSLG